MLLWPLLHGSALAQPAASPAAITDAARRHHRTHAADILRELRDLVQLPNVADNRADIRRNAEHLQALFTRRGFDTRLLTAGDAAPAVFAERQTPGATRTVVFYAHYDGQPVDAAEWTDAPWRATLRTASLEDVGQVMSWDALPAELPAEARLYGRSSSDDKGPIVAFLCAVDELAAAGIPPGVHLKVFLEGEEEAG